MSDHSVLSPSAAEQWVNCPGSVQMRQKYPERADSTKSMEGTSAHDVCLDMMDGIATPLNSISANGVAVTEEMVEGARMYADTFPDGADVHLEELVQISAVHALCFGTPDAWYEPNTRSLNITDYKFGHSFVDAYENWQLICYAAGLLANRGSAEVITLDLSIVQPRNFHQDGPIRNWIVTSEELRPYIAKARAAAHEALGPNPKLKSGSHCHYCPAAHACPALQQSMQNALDVAHELLPVDMSPAALGLMMRQVAHGIELLKSMQEGMAAEAMSIIRSGAQVPGYEIRRGGSSTKWSKPHAEIAALGMMLGVPLAKEACITPKQAEAAFKKKGVDVAVISAYSTSIPGELKLMTEDNSLTRKVFGNIENKS